MARKKTPIPDAPLYYTTHQVAKYLGVSLPTVVNWVNAGILRAHRTPGGHRRIAHQDVINFAQVHDYPLTRPMLNREFANKRVLIIDHERDFSEMVREYLTARGDLEVAIADSGFRAGVAVAGFRPDLVIFDPLMPDLDLGELREALRRDDGRTVSLIAVTGYRDAESERRLHGQQLDGVIEKPLMLDELLDLIRAQLSP